MLEGSKMFNNYEKEHKKMSYRSFMDFFNIDLILCNSIAENCELEVINVPELEDDKYIEVFQYYIVGANDVDTLTLLNEVIYYCNELDIYVLGITHFGTRWDYVLTDVDLIENKEGVFYPSL